MDPLGAAASIISLLHATRIVSSWISHVVHLDGHLLELHSELNCFEILMQGLQCAVDGGGLSPNALKQTVKAIAEAEKTIEDLKLVLVRAQNSQAWDHSRLRFVMRPSKCDSIRNRIQGHTRSLTSIMLVVMHTSRYVCLLNCVVSRVSIRSQMLTANNSLSEIVNKGTPVFSAS
jgi:hypothetical protein